MLLYSPPPLVNSFFALLMPQVADECKARKIEEVYRRLHEQVGAGGSRGIEMPASVWRGTRAG